MDLFWMEIEEIRRRKADIYEQRFRSTVPASKPEPEPEPESSMPRFDPFDFSTFGRDVPDDLPHLPSESPGRWGVKLTKDVASISMWPRLLLSGIPPTVDDMEADQGELNDPKEGVKDPTKTLKRTHLLDGVAQDEDGVTPMIEVGGTPAILKSAVKAGTKTLKRVKLNDDPHVITPSSRPYSTRTGSLKRTPGASGKNKRIVSGEYKVDVDAGNLPEAVKPRGAVHRLQELFRPKTPVGHPQSPTRPVTPNSGASFMAATSASQAKVAALDTVTLGRNEEGTLKNTTKPGKGGRRTLAAGLRGLGRLDSHAKQQPGSKSLSRETGRKVAVELEKEGTLSLSRSEAKEAGRAVKRAKPAWK